MAESITPALDGIKISPASNLLTIPFELRQQIYADVYEGPNGFGTLVPPGFPCEDSISAAPTSDTRIALMLVCKQLYEEVLPYFYDNHTVYCLVLEPGMKLVKNEAEAWEPGPLEEGDQEPHLKILNNPHFRLMHRLYVRCKVYPKPCAERTLETRLAPDLTEIDEPDLDNESRAGSESSVEAQAGDQRDALDYLARKLDNQQACKNYAAHVDSVIRACLDASGPDTKILSMDLELCRLPWSSTDRYLFDDAGNMADVSSMELLDKAWRESALAILSRYIDPVKRASQAGALYLWETCGGSQFTIDRWPGPNEWKATFPSRRHCCSGLLKWKGHMVDKALEKEVNDLADDASSDLISFET